MLLFKSLTNILFAFTANLLLISSRVLRCLGIYGYCTKQSFTARRYLLPYRDNWKVYYTVTITLSFFKKNCMTADKFQQYRLNFVRIGLSLKSDQIYKFRPRISLIKYFIIKKSKFCPRISLIKYVIIRSIILVR